MDIRILQPGDEDLLARAVAMIEEAELTPQRAAAHLADGSLVAVVAVEADQPIGFIYGFALQRFEHTDLRIYSVDVDEPHRRRGVARAMLERLKALCGERGWAGMWVLTTQNNAAALRLYESAGGVRPPPDDVVMFDFY
ncbi:MAG: GNAT family N-acetyltransferase [Phenylobacterium sp.]